MVKILARPETSEGVRALARLSAGHLEMTLDVTPRSVSLARKIAAVGVDMAVQEDARAHPFDRSAHRLEPPVWRVGALIGAGGRAVRDQDIEMSWTQPQAQGQHLGHHLPLGVLVRSLAVPNRALQAGDPQPPLPHDPAVDLSGGRVITLAPRRIMVAAHEEQWRGVQRREDVEVVGGQIPAADHQIDPTLAGNRPLVEQLLLHLIADRQQTNIGRSQRPSAATRAR